MSQDTDQATKIMIIRHAEKPPSAALPYGVNLQGEQDEESLIVQGWQRAGALVVLFAPSKGFFQNPDIATPQFIYASSGKSMRPQETVTPLIAKLGVTPNFSFSKGHERKVAASALACKGVVLISWQHEDIPAIASNIPLSSNNTISIPTEWPADRFDVIWVFDKDPKGAGYIFNQIPQLLLAGDQPL